MNSFRTVFSIAENTHNVKQHDAIMMTSSSINAGVGTSFSAEVYFYAENTRRGVNGKPMVVGTAGGSPPDNPSTTGPNQILRGSSNHESDHDAQIIFPFQIKSTLGFTGANLYGLRY